MTLLQEFSQALEGGHALGEFVAEGRRDVIGEWRRAFDDRDAAATGATAKALGLAIRKLGALPDGRAAGLQLVDRLLLEHEKNFHRVITSQRQQNLKPTLRLLVEMVEFDGGACSSRVYTMLDPVSTKGLHRLLQEKTLGKRKRTETAGPTREITIELLAALINCCPTAQATELLSVRPIVNDIFKHVEADTPESLRKLLDALLGVLANEQVTRQIKVQVMNEHNTSRLLSLYAVPGTRQIAHDFLLKLATDTTYGILFAADGFRPPKKAHSLYNPIVGSLSLRMRPVEDSLQQELLLKALAETPELVPHFLINAKLDLTPKLDEAWIKTVNLVRAIIRLPVVAPDLTDAPATAVAESILPTCLSKHMAKLLQHESDLVRLTGISALRDSLRKLDTIEDPSDELVDVLVNRLPDMAILLACTSGALDSEPKKLLRQAAIEVVRLAISHFEELATVDLSELFATILTAEGDAATDGERADVIAMLAYLPSVQLFGKSNSIFQAIVRHVIDREDVAAPVDALHQVVVNATTAYPADLPNRSLGLIAALRQHREQVDFVEDCLRKLQTTPVKYYGGRCTSPLLAVMHEQTQYRADAIPLVRAFATMLWQIGEDVPTELIGASFVPVDDVEWQAFAALTTVLRGGSAEIIKTEAARQALKSLMQRALPATEIFDELAPRLLVVGDVDTAALFTLLERGASLSHISHLIDEDAAIATLQHVGTLSQLAALSSRISSSSGVLQVLQRAPALPCDIEGFALLLQQLVEQNLAPSDETSTSLDWSIERAADLNDGAVDEQLDALIASAHGTVQQVERFYRRTNGAYIGCLIRAPRFADVAALKLDLARPAHREILRAHRAEALARVQKVVELDGRLSLLDAWTEDVTISASFHRALVSKLTRRFAEDRKEEGKQLSAEVLDATAHIAAYALRNPKFAIDAKVLLDAMVTAALENQKHYPQVLALLTSIAQSTETEVYNYARTMQEIVSSGIADTTLPLALSKRLPKAAATGALLDALLLEWRLTTSERDRDLYRIVQQIERLGGVSIASRIAAVHFADGPAFVRKQGRLELNISRETCRATVSDEQGGYDVLSILSVSAALDLTAFTARQACENGLVSVALYALAQDSIAARRMAVQLLTGIWAAYQDSDLASLMAILGESLAADDLERRPLPKVLAVFLAQAAAVLKSPSHHLYESVNRFILSRPQIDLEDVPMFYSLLSENGRSLRWLADVLKGSADDEASLELMQRRHALEIMMGYAGSRLDTSLGGSTTGTTSNNAASAAQTLLAAVPPHAAPRIRAGGHVFDRLALQRKSRRSNLAAGQSARSLHRSAADT